MAYHGSIHWSASRHFGLMLPRPSACCPRAGIVPSSASLSWQSRWRWGVVGCASCGVRRPPGQWSPGGLRSLREQASFGLKFDPSVDQAQLRRGKGPPWCRGRVWDAGSGLSSCYWGGWRPEPQLQRWAVSLRSALLSRKALVLDPESAVNHCVCVLSRKRVRSGIWLESGYAWLCLRVWGGIKWLAEQSFRHRDIREKRFRVEMN